MSRWNERSDVARGDDYDRRWHELEAAGESIHGEADLVEALLQEAGVMSPAVLDAGCGTGRVAIELDRRGMTTVGVDLDPGMLGAAREKAPAIEWHLGDLGEVELGRSFDLVALPGNVMIFLAPGSEPEVLANLRRHLKPGGFLLAGFQLEAGRLSLADYDAHAAIAGLALVDRWSTWDREPFVRGDYAVSLHTRRDTLG